MLKVSMNDDSWRKYLTKLCQENLKKSIIKKYIESAKMIHYSKYIYNLQITYV